MLAGESCGVTDHTMQAWVARPTVAAAKVQLWNHFDSVQVEGNLVHRSRMGDHTEVQSSGI